MRPRQEWDLKPKAMLDTNVFNDILDGRMQLVDLQTFDLWATHIQADEIGRTKDSLRREELSRIFKELRPDTKATGSFVLGVSRLGEACLGDGETYHKILMGLRAMQKDPEGKNESNIMDALIAETSIQQHMTLITADSHLARVVISLGGTVSRLRRQNG